MTCNMLGCRCRVQVLLSYTGKYLVYAPVKKCEASSSLLVYLGEQWRNTGGLNFSNRIITGTH